MTNKKKLNATEAQAEFQSQMSQISMGMCKVTVRELIKGYYRDFMNFDDAVIAYNKQLQISPKYTDAFDYKKEQRDRIIRTMLMGLPLDTMYWIDRGKQYENDPNEPRYELLDGQMRANVIYDYVAGGFSILCNGNPLYFFNMTSDAQDAILGYELSVCICDGRHPEKLEKLKLEKEQVNKKKQRIRKTASEQNVYDDEYIYLILSGWFNKYAKPILSVLCLLHHTDEDVKCGFRPYDEDISPEVMRNTFNEAILKFGQASYMMKTGGLTDSMIKTGVIDSMIKTDSMIKYYNSTCEMLEGWSWRAIVYDMLETIDFVKNNSPYFDYEHEQFIKIIQALDIYHDFDDVVNSPDVTTDALMSCAALLAENIMQDISRDVFKKDLDFTGMKSVW